jgi:hypothetical protein
MSVYENGIIGELQRNIIIAKYGKSLHADCVSVRLLENTVDLINRKNTEIKKLQKCKATDHKHHKGKHCFLNHTILHIVIHLLFHLVLHGVLEHFIH